MSFQTILNRLAPSDYALLPSHANHPKHDIPSSLCSRLALSIPRRYTRILLAGFTALLLYLFFFTSRLRKHDVVAFPAEAWPGPTGKPPLYDQYREYERHLPAHNLDLPYPNGKHAKFIYFGNFQQGRRMGERVARDDV
ncbi:hypothetical protein F5887DRAFT_225590 [Amanita rubescens]|nr:hypothetical protein F5887DRAFT_225590 [Amanita rubescens]